MILWMDNDHGLLDGPIFTIGYSLKSQGRRWLDCQIYKETGKKRLPVFKVYAVFYFGFCGVTYTKPASDLYLNIVTFRQTFRTVSVK